ncbi:hypothetical protein HanIR_Chr09g0394101 [Helianthus annuus]|nr:hypothetical protein HanIR_Chr09g0394101 [Helianthus annuus]
MRVIQKFLLHFQDQGSYPCSGLYGYCHTYPFEREVVKLLKVSANQLLDKNIELANEGSFPGERKASLNRKFAFKIAVGSFNIKNKSDGYSVSKLTENPLVISVLDKKFDDIQPVDVDGHVGYPWHYSLVVSWGWDKAYDH